MYPSHELCLLLFTNKINGISNKTKQKSKKQNKTKKIQNKTSISIRWNMNKMSILYFIVSPCDGITCQNDGSCRVDNGTASCLCKGGYTGTNCEGTVTTFTYCYL